MYVPLTSDARTLLGEVARKERRRPQDQAAVMIETALGLRGTEDGQPAKVLRFDSLDALAQEEGEA